MLWLLSESMTLLTLVFCPKIVTVKSPFKSYGFSINPQNVILIYCYCGTTQKRQSHLCSVERVAFKLTEQLMIGCKKIVRFRTQYLKVIPIEHTV